MSEKLEDLKEVHIRWQSAANVQLGVTNNIISTISIGFLAFAFDKDFLSTFSISQKSEFNCKMLFHILAIISLIVSIGLGLATSLSRLNDFRITRNIALTKWRFYKLSNSSIEPLVKHLPKPKIKSSFLLKKLLLGPNILLREETENLKEGDPTLNKFIALRALSDRLGGFTYCGLKWQLLLLFLSLILYSLSLYM